MIDLEPRTNTKDRLQPEGETKDLPIGHKVDQVKKLGSQLNLEEEKLLANVIYKNKDLFS